MKRLVVCLLLVLAPLRVGAAMPYLYSRSAVVYDMGQGRVLLEKQADAVAPVASLTKLMTAMVALDQHPALDEPLTIEPADVDRIKRSPSRLPVGTTLARGEMLRLALMASENRSASALARSIAGGKSMFVAKMNEKASALGMHHTRFQDPTGLSPHNVSSARDLLSMADAASHYPLIREFTTLSNHRVEVARRSLRYRNTLLMPREPDWGIQLSKTGFINEAGHCIVLKADLGSGPVIIVLMGAASNWKRTADLISIRHWLGGKEVNGAMQQAAYPAKPISHHRAKAVVHHGKVRQAPYRSHRT
ncbi:D-alanyl-D-alanine endopeptidase [Cupriavidus yeoncheonensis]|uniref:D-alanyl-D-alanine endopeptidase n=1 Tax=Cupriavidus yeoncheonensis TaxID=1462994 RepID=A0A916IZC2_9BURK|nr:serine hydrolase [Cupriavidus yeoncheonensis]CAG2154841.1 D-alanyl-D-alanine endopeptidase [Cupriavidus yeoncheonensis]